MPKTTPQTSDSLFPTQSQFPTSLNMVLAGAALAIITFLAGLVGFLSLNQAPTQPPVVQQTN